MPCEFGQFGLDRRVIDMQSYPVPMVPGPVKLPQTVIDAFSVNYGSADLEPEFFELYHKTTANLQKIMDTANSVVVLSGEGMAALWGAMKSSIVRGDKVLAVATGLFGHGIADMAQSIGAEVHKVSLPDDQTLSDTSEIETVIDTFKPKMITAVHCETPSGTLNPLMDLGRLKDNYHVPLLYVDAVSSIGGTPVMTDLWNIDLCLGGAQKCLSAPADTAFLSVSESAWEIIEKVDYVGYDALKPFREITDKHYFPYTPNWHGLAALNAGAEIILSEGLPACFERHATVASLCRQRLHEMGITLFPAHGSVPSPTVTSAYLPHGVKWEDFDARLRENGLVLGGNYGALAGKIFRMGHMGTQADEALVTEALNIVHKSLP